MRHKGYNSNVSSNANSVASKYKYNGKELNEELGLDWYDYGARNYDAALGRWFSVDNYSELAYELTPYRYSFNNPINYKDPDGNFELDPEVAKNNPKLVSYLKGLVDEWNNKSEDFKKAFYETSGLNESQVLDMLTYGKGPKLTVKNLDIDTNNDGNDDTFVNGATYLTRDRNTGDFKNAENGQGSIALDDDVVDSYTNATTQLDSESGKTLVESTLFHEGVHFGRAKTGKNRRMSNNSGNNIEPGKEFERRAYGQDIGRFTVKTYVLKKQRVNKMQSSGIKMQPVKIIAPKILQQ
jgi:RHS repeat-associated protein